MAGFQPARENVRAESIEEWMERRRREVAVRDWQAELAGGAAWAASNVSGELLHTPRPNDVVTLGVQTLQQGGGPAPKSSVGGTATFAAPADEFVRTASWPPAQSRVRPVAYRPTVAPRPAPPRTQPPAAEDEMTKLRREQAAFKEVVREESRRNSWMAIPALAPVAAVLLAEGAGLLAGGFAASQVRRAPLNLFGREPGLTPRPPAARPTAPPLTTSEKTVLRDAARTKFARANPGYSKAWEVDIHHRIDLRFAHLFPRADPNRLANLAALQKGAHNIATQAGNAFVRGLGGRQPSQAEVMAHTLRVDRLIEAYLMRAGTPKPPPKAPR